jgi:DNA-binding transcriptional regulator YdaS (Cro superfamily)
MDAFQSYLEQQRGRSVQLAKSLGVTPGAISQWRRVPSERVLEVEAATGIPRHTLRPDLYSVALKPHRKRDTQRPSHAKDAAKPGRLPKWGSLRGLIVLEPGFDPTAPVVPEHPWEAEGVLRRETPGK